MPDNTNKNSDSPKVMPESPGGEVKKEVKDEQLDSFRERLQKGYEEKFAKLKEKFVKSKTGQIGDKEIFKIFDKQTGRVKAAYDEAYGKYKDLSESQRRSMENKLAEEAERIATERMKEILGIMEKIVKGEVIVEEDIATMTSVFNALSMSKDGTKIRGAFEDLAAGRELATYKMAEIVDMLTVSGMGNEAKPAEIYNCYRNSQVAGLIMMMGGRDRMQLLKTIAARKEAKEAAILVESLCIVGAVSMKQVEELLNSAVATRYIIERIRPKLESGEIARMKFEAREVLAKETDRYSRNFANNPLNDAVGKPMVKLGIAMWSAAVIAANVATEWREDKSEMLKEMSQNVYLWAGIAGLAYSGGDLLPHLKRLYPSLGELIDKATESVKNKISPPTEQEKERMVDYRRSLIGEILLNNSPLLKFFEEVEDGKNGFEFTVDFLQKKGDKAGILTIQELENECEKGRKEFLTNARKFSQSDEKLSMEINNVIIFASMNGIKTGNDFKEMMERLKKENGIN